MSESVDPPGQSQPERPESPRFFCHKCTVQFVNVGEDYKCPNCSSEFIEQVETVPHLQKGLRAESASQAQQNAPQPQTSQQPDPRAHMQNFVQWQHIPIFQSLNQNLRQHLANQARQRQEAAPGQQNVTGEQNATGPQNVPEQQNTAEQQNETGQQNAPRRPNLPHWQQFTQWLQQHMVPANNTPPAENTAPAENTPPAENSQDGSADVPNEPAPAQNTTGNPIMNDVAFLLGGQRAPNAPGSLMENLLMQIGNVVGGAVSESAVPGAETAGTPFVLVGGPGEYILGADNLADFDAVVAQLLGQLEGFGPPPMPTNLIDSIPIEDVSEEQANAKMTCSVCWELFNKDEKIARLSCDHFFHKTCIEPWLKLHATCPICRHRLIPDPPPASNPPPPTSNPPPPPTTNAAGTQTGANAGARLFNPLNGAPNIRRIVQQLNMAPAGFAAAWGTVPDAQFLNNGVLFANITALNPDLNTNTNTNTNATDNANTNTNTDDRPPPTQGYNMDIDYD